MAIFTMIVTSLLISAASAVVQSALRSKPKNERQKPAKAFTTPTNVEGRVQPLVFGTERINSPNLAWFGNPRSDPIKKQVGLGLFSKNATVGFVYSGDVQLGICRGGNGTILRRMWAGEKELTTRVPFGETYDPFTHGEITSVFTLDTLFDRQQAARFNGPMRYYDGRSDQIVDPLLAVEQSPTTAYRGTAYVVFQDVEVGTSPEVPFVSFEVSRFPSALLDSAADPAYTAGHNIVNTFDCNPMEVLYELLTDGDYGFKIPASKIDTAQFARVAEILFDEGNGMSIQLDQETQAQDFIDIIQDQIEGVVFLDQTQSKISVALARDDYSIPSLPSLDNSNVIAVRKFSRITWDGTSNQVRIQYDDRSREYFETFAQRADNANQFNQGGEIVSTTIRYPGVKDPTLANAIAARELRFLTLPVSEATIQVDRTFFDINPLDVVKWSNPRLGIVDLVMRVYAVDFGDIDSGTITLRLVEDVFGVSAAFGVQNPLFVDPNSDVAAIPLDEHIVEEAPKAIIDRDPTFPERTDRVLVSARSQGAATGLRLYSRHTTPPTLPSTASYEVDGESQNLFRIGLLGTTLTSADANPTTSISVTVDDDSASRILSTLPEGAISPAQVGQSLFNLVKIDDEYIGFLDSGPDQVTSVPLTTCYRGLMDSVIADHTIGAKVYFLASGYMLSDSEIPVGDSVQIQPRAFSATDILTEGESETFELTMDNRYRKPYPPSRMDLNTVRMDTTIDTSSGLVVDWYRRDWETTDEVASLEVDAATLDAGFQAKHAHENRVVVTDPDGNEVVNSGWVAATTTTFDRAELLAKTNALVPASYDVSIAARHDADGLTDEESRYNLELNTVPTDSELDGLFNYGTLGANAISGPFTVAASVVHDFRLEEGTLGADVEYRVGTGGAWTQLIASGATTGSTTSLTIGNELYVRHLDSTDNDTYVLLFGQENGGSDVCSGVLTDDIQYDSLMAYWNMNEVSDGTSAVSRSVRLGSQQDLVAVNNPESFAGKFGNAVRIFDNGTNTEYLRVVDSARLDDISLPNADWTIMCFARIETTSSGGGSQVLMAHLDLSSGSPFTNRSFFLNYTGNTNKFNAALYSTSSPFVKSVTCTTSVTADVYHHVALSFDQSTGTYTIYMNGVSEDSDTVAGSFRAGSTTTANLTVGEFESAGVSFDAATDHAIDEVRIYHRLLSAGEILAISDSTQPL